MDGTHPKTDLDAPMSNLEGEEDQYLSGEEEEEEEDMDNEDSSGVNPPMAHHHLGRNNSTPSPPQDYFSSRRGSPSETTDLEDRKRIERELLAQKELAIKREEQNPLYNNGRSSSNKSETPSPSSPQQTQYLYAANYNYAAAAAAAAAAAFLSPQHLAAAAAAQAAAAAAQQAALPAIGGGGGGGESSAGSATPPDNNNGTAADDQSKYTYEEQFKQEKAHAKSFEELYEINDDPRRREFLDDLFNFMQKRGTPVNRVPIMAKQVLDLYELYRLVVQRGGLVEVINKKIWREITKGLNLPSSITSAAFTLRTQYMRYLYPYECDREKLSTTEELQAAIDGNRREGRRSSYGPYGELVGPAAVAVSRNSQHPPLSSPLSLVSRHVNGHGSTPGGLSSGRGSASPLPLPYFHSNSTPAQLPLNLAHQENGLYSSHGLSSGPSTEQETEIEASHLRELINFQLNYGLIPQAGMFPFFPATQQMANFPGLGIDKEKIVEFDKKWRQRVENNGSRVEKSSSWNSSKSRIKQEHDGTNGCVENVSGEEDNCNSVPSTPNPMVMPQQEALNLEVSRNSSNNDQKPLNMKRKAQEEESMSTTKRLLNDDERFSQRPGMPQAHIKLGSNRGPDGRLQSETTLSISMEVNGILYQGVLYASPNHRNRL